MIICHHREEIATALKGKTDMDKTSDKNSYERYEKFLDWTLDKQIDEYKIFSLTIHDSQLSVVKNYLWLAAMVVGANCSLLAYMDFSLSNLTALQAVTGACVMFSTIISVVTFISGTQLLLAEKGGRVPNITDSYLINLNEAYGPDDSPNVVKVKNRMIAQLQFSIDYLREITSTKALKMRKLNSKLVISVALSSIASFFYYLFQ